MTSSYPGSLDNLATNKTNSTPTIDDHADHHNDLADAVNKIEAELGTNPSGGAATVAAALVPGSGAAGHTVEDEGTPLTARQSLNFVGAGVTAADSGGKTVVTIPGGGGGFQAATTIRYVAGTGVGLTGSDSNDGLSPSTAMATLQAAYTSLPDTSGSDHGGGTIVLLPGYHDVGTGFVGTGLQKHVVFTSLSGYSP
jgi:hypothetical protein